MNQFTLAKRWWGPVICFALLALFIIRPLGVSPPQSLQTDFDTTRAVGRLKTILGDERPHPTGTDASDAVLQRLLTEIRQLGFAPEVRDAFHCNAFRKGAAICARPRNVAFWVTAPGDNAVMLTAHYDSVPAGPGAADDGMGVAIALEVAHLLKQRPLARPVLVLITDGEEAGLVGASAFAANDPLRTRIGAVVNMEARGTTGVANMFQTSTPNGRDIDAIRGGGIASTASAIAADFYKLLPNDTDLTMLLPLKVDAANFAIQSAGKRYHTPLDNLSYLDPHSVRQMGAGALSAMRGFVASDGKRDEGQRVFADIDQRILLVLPNGVALLILIVGLVSAVIVFARSAPGKPVRTILAPLIAVVAGTVLALALSALVAAIRPEMAYGTAYPIALRAGYGAAALLGAVLAMRFMGITDSVRLAAAGWIWLTVLILGVFAFVPGLSILAAWALFPVICAAVTTFVPAWRRATPVLFGIAAVIFALVALPLAGGLEEGLFVENAAPAAFVLVFMIIFFMPGAGGRSVPLAAAGVLAVSCVAALTVPAYSRDAPRHLNVVHQDKDGQGTFLVFDNGPLPAAMKAKAAFAATPDEDRNWHASAPAIVDNGTLRVVSASLPDGARSYSLQADAPMADRQEFRIKDGEGIRQLAVNGSPLSLKRPVVYAGCTGRSCRRFDMTMVVDKGAPLPQISWRRVRYGVGTAAAALVAARPGDAQPVHVGDQQVIIRTVKLGTNGKPNMSPSAGAMK